MMEYRKANLTELELLWNRNIAENPDDPRWVDWKEEYIGYNMRGEASTFAVICNDIPVGEVTLLCSPACKAVGGRRSLADGEKIANVNALRIGKEYEGRGYISALMRHTEDYARDAGYTRLTIGVEAREARNLAIYLHWGFTDFLFSDTEDGALVLYYAKNL